MLKTYKKINSFKIFPLKATLTPIALSLMLTACGGGSTDTPTEKVIDKPVAKVEKCLGAEINSQTSCLELSSRQSIIYKNDDTEKDGVALFLHGAPGQASKVMDIFDAKMIANKHNLVAISPEGIESTWGWLSVNSKSTDANADVDYLSELLTKIKSEHNINSDKVYVFGYSAGGFMAYKLACEIPEQITAIVSLAGQLRGTLASCENSTPLAVHHFHSPTDEAVPYKGRDIGSITSVDDTINLWRINNGCDASFTEQDHVGVTAESSKTLTISYNTCLAPVTLSQMAFVTHEADYISDNLYTIYQGIFTE
jgi:polyhydroxybutyrate depolymerase